MKSINLIEDKIAFTFLENTSNRGFSKKTDAGLIVQENEEHQINQARWGKILKCSPNVTEVKKSQFILIEPMEWTRAIQLDEVSDEEFWITSESKVLAVSDTEPELI